MWRAALSKCSSSAKDAASIVNAGAWREGRNDTFLDLLEDSGEAISRIGGDDVFVEALLRLDARPGVVDAELALELALDGLQDARVPFRREAALLPLRYLSIRSLHYY